MDRYAVNIDWRNRKLALDRTFSSAAALRKRFETQNMGKLTHDLVLKPYATQKVDLMPNGNIIGEQLLINGLKRNKDRGIRVHKTTCEGLVGPIKCVVENKTRKMVRIRRDSPIAVIRVAPPKSTPSLEESSASCSVVVTENPEVHTEVYEVSGTNTNDPTIEHEGISLSTVEAEDTVNAEPVDIKDTPAIDFSDLKISQTLAVTKTNKKVRLGAKQPIANSNDTKAATTGPPTSTPSFNTLDVGKLVGKAATHDGKRTATRREGFHAAAIQDTQEEKRNKYLSSLFFLMLNFISVTQKGGTDAEDFYTMVNRKDPITKFLSGEIHEKFCTDEEGRKDRGHRRQKKASIILPDL